MHVRGRHRYLPVAVVVVSVLVAAVGYLTIWVNASASGRVAGYVPVLPAGATAAPVMQMPVVARSSGGSALAGANAAWVSRTSVATGIPAVAVAAYANAALNQPVGCHLGWTTLAGIGWIESGHGSHGGSLLLANGDTTGAILGPQLEGGLGRAMGPMQFIADTWNRWARDGDGNGTADIDNINDAALTAARYLCAQGRDLAQGSDWAAAVYSYNHAQWYVDEVYAAAEQYASRAR